MIKVLWFCLLVTMVITVSSCEEEEIKPSHVPPGLMQVPPGFDEIPQPEDNHYTYERWKLGKKMFYDPIMSVDSTISCASCHDPDLAFSDGGSVSLGVDDRPGKRNAPTLANVAYHPYYTREGGVPTLEMQVLVPIQEHDEFDFNIVLLAQKLNQDTNYVRMSMEAYGRVPDAFTITRSLACFERSLISGYSRYDHYVSYDDKSALTQREIRGMNLFFSDRTDCSKCHSGFNFTNYTFENNGLYEEYSDIGRFLLTDEQDDLATFKVPSLRNVSVTQPYMHDGSIETLDDVVEHYDSGGKSHVNKSKFIRPLGLSEQEKADLVAFLTALTDEHFISSADFGE